MVNKIQKQVRIHFIFISDIFFAKYKIWHNFSDCFTLNEWRRNYLIWQMKWQSHVCLLTHSITMTHHHSLGSPSSFKNEWILKWMSRLRMNEEWVNQSISVIHCFFFVEEGVVLLVVFLYRICLIIKKYCVKSCRVYTIVKYKSLKIYFLKFTNYKQELQTNLFWLGFYQGLTKDWPQWMMFTEGSSKATTRRWWSRQTWTKWSQRCTRKAFSQSIWLRDTR